MFVVGEMYISFLLMMDDLNMQAGQWHFPLKTGFFRASRAVSALASVATIWSHTFPVALPAERLGAERLGCGAKVLLT